MHCSVLGSCGVGLVGVGDPLGLPVLEPVFVVGAGVVDALLEKAM